MIFGFNHFVSILPSMLSIKNGILPLIFHTHTKKKLSSSLQILSFLRFQFQFQQKFQFQNYYGWWFRVNRVQIVIQFTNIEMLCLACYRFNCFILGGTHIQERLQALTVKERNNLKETMWHMGLSLLYFVFFQVLFCSYIYIYILSLILLVIYMNNFIYVHCLF